MSSSRIAVLLLFLSVMPARAEEPPSEPSDAAVESEDEAPPVGGLFGLFGRGRKAPTPRTQAPAVSAPTPAAPAVAATPKIVAPAPTEGMPAPAPEAPEIAPEATVKPAAPAARAMETPEEKPALPEAEEELKAPQTAPAKETGKAALREPVPGGKPRGKSDVELPTAEIQGEIEKPDIFFLVPRARDQSDEQMIRARIRREINRPVIKDWVEEEMLLK